MGVMKTKQIQAGKQYRSTAKSDDPHILATVEKVERFTVFYSVPGLPYCKAPEHIFAAVYEEA